jgi:hypothetical protein
MLLQPQKEILILYLLQQNKAPHHPPKKGGGGGMDYKNEVIIFIYMLTVVS